MSDLITELKQLRLYGMASSYAEVLQNSAGGGTEQAEWLLRHLITAEQTDRGLRSIRYQMHVAKFPMHRDLAGFEFDRSKVDRQQISVFATAEFTERAENIVLIGGTGTGKTHLAVAITASVVRAGARGRYFNTVDLVNRLEEESRLGKAGALAAQLSRLDLVVLDELGYLLARADDIQRFEESRDAR